MFDRIWKGSRTASGTLGWVIFAASFMCLGSVGNAEASGFDKTITDIENPTVEARVTTLDVSASRSLVSVKRCVFEFCPTPGVLSSESWTHSLAGSTGEGLSAQQHPVVTVQRNPTFVTLSGELSTDVAEGEESYEDMELCSGSRHTTKSERLDVTLEGFYQAGNSAAPGNPAISLATQIEDPWNDSCGQSTGAIDTSTRTTRIDLLSAFGTSGTSGSWVPQAGNLTTTENGCSDSYCDFTITGSNLNGASTYSGHAEGSFVLGLRLIYPEEGRGTSVVPETRIAKAPRKLVRTRKARTTVRFRFASSGPRGTSFRCRLDNGAFKPCRPSIKRRVGKGNHRLAVAATYKGKTDKTPAVYRWKVKKIPGSR
jgi:hypothetical protein